MIDKKPPQSRKLVAQKVGAVDKRRRPRGLTKAIRTAIEAIMFDRCTRAQACEKAQITERAFYLGLEKPEVARFWNQQLVVLRQGERAANIHALTNVRDGSSQMARVQAVRTLELIADVAERQAPGGHVSLPGLTIQIVNSPAPPLQREPIDVTPDKD